MADLFSKEVRSKMMSAVKGKDTEPELFIRRGLHKLGFRYKIHDRRLPGTPDMVFPRHRAVIFVHGCFWHGHLCHQFKWPSTREEFWKNKITHNKEMDRTHVVRLRELNWRVGVVWQCGIKGKYRLPGEELVELCAIWLNSDMMSLELGGQC